MSKIYLAIIAKEDIVLYAYGHTPEVAQGNLERNLKDMQVRFISPEVSIYDVTDGNEWSFDKAVLYFQLYMDGKPLFPVMNTKISFIKNRPLRISKRGT